jgi:OmpA-OmpF porin, OOP family
MKNAIKRPALAGTKLPVKLALLTLALAGAQIASAAEPGWYFGANLGESEASIDDSGIVARQLANGSTNIRLDTKDSKTGYKVFTGYQFNRFFAIEGGYFDLGNFSYRSFTTPQAVYTGDSKVRGINADLVGILPMGERFSAFARAGLTHTDVKNKYRGYGAARVSTFGTSDRDDSYKYGLGLQYDFTDNFAMRLEAERYDSVNRMFNKRMVDMYSVGVVYRFGQPVAAVAPVRAPVSTAPAQPAVAPAPAPAPTPVTPPAPTRVTVSADSLFTFDSAEVSAAGRAELDKLAADLRGVEYDTIIVIGHTDRMGSAAYNQGLSVRRANAVRDYLVNSARIPAARINTRGVGSSQPVTTAAQCGTQLSRAQLIACLAPDRRVEVEVTGTRSQ